MYQVFWRNNVGTGNKLRIKHRDSIYPDVDKVPIAITLVIFVQTGVGIVFVAKFVELCSHLILVLLSNDLCWYLISKKSSFFCTNKDDWLEVFEKNVKIRLAKKSKSKTNRYKEAREKILHLFFVSHVFENYYLVLLGIVQIRPAPKQSFISSHTLITLFKNFIIGIRSIFNNWWSLI